MSKIILHIGTHKTATSSLQYVLSSNRSLLESLGISYPRAEWGTAHHSLPAHWVPLPEKYQLKGGIDAWRRGLGVMSDRDYTVLLSSEEFSRGAPDRVHMGQLRELLRGFDEVEIWCTLRNQASYIQACYMQIMVTRPPPDISELVGTALETHFCDGLFLDYGELHRHLCQGFDPSEIRYLCFEAACREPGGIVGYYLGRLHQRLPHLAQTDFADNFANRSPLPLTAMLAAAISPGDAPPGEELLEIAGRCVADLNGPARASIFSSSEYEQIATAFEPLNRRFEESLVTQGQSFSLAPIELPPGTVFRDKIDLDRYANSLLPKLPELKAG